MNCKVSTSSAISSDHLHERGNSKFDALACEYYHPIIMPSAIVILNTDIGKENEVAESVSKFPGVESSDVVYGVYDIVAKVSSDTNDDLDSMIMNQIRQVPFVRSTLTLIVSREYKRT
jgi:DNA-binding Lrp family transcriptional regulator